jgi:hypothetical protein
MYIKTPRHVHTPLSALFNSPPIRASVIGAIFCGCRGNEDQHSKKLVTASTQNANLTYHDPKTLYASLTPRAIFVIPTQWTYTLPPSAWRIYRLDAL